MVENSEQPGNSAAPSPCSFCGRVDDTMPSMSGGFGGGATICLACAELLVREAAEGPGTEGGPAPGPEDPRIARMMRAVRSHEAALEEGRSPTVVRPGFTESDLAAILDADNPAGFDLGELDGRETIRFSAALSARNLGREVAGLRADRARLEAHVASLGWIPMRYKDRPPGFVEARKKVCTSPSICFEFGDKAPVCGPCDDAAWRACMGSPRP